MRLKFRQDLKQEFGQFFSAKFVFKLVIWTQPSGPLCLWQCFSSGFSRENIEAHCTVCTMLKSKLKPLFFTYFAIVISYDSSDKGDDESGHSQPRCRPPPFPTLSILSIFTLTLSTFGNSPHKLKIFLKHEISNLCLYTWYCCHDNDIWQSQISDKFMYTWIPWLQGS